MPGDATAAPATNGTSAPTTPAPGVSTPTATPKNGEGAVVNPPKAAVQTDTAPKWQPWKDKVRFGDGTEEEFEVPDVETLRRMRLHQKGFDRASKRALKAEAEVEHIRRLAEESPEEFLRAFKHDPKNLAKKWAEEELKRLEMTQEQRAADDARREVMRLKAEAAAAKKELESMLQQKQLEAQWETERPQWADALGKRNRIGDESYIELASQVRKHLEANGINASIEQICALADEEDARISSRYVEGVPVSRLMEGIAKRAQAADVPLILKALAPKLAPQLLPQMLWDMLADDSQRRGIMSIGLAWHKGLKGTQSATPPPVQAKPQEPKRIRSEAEWRAERDARR